MNTDETLKGRLEHVHSRHDLDRTEVASNVRSKEHYAERTVLPVTWEGWTFFGLLSDPSLHPALHFVMDPISQGAFGAIASLAVAKTSHSRLAVLAGTFSGMLADADIFIRSSEDPLLNLEFHRQFSHSLVFIPAGGLIAAIVLFLFVFRKISFWWLLLYSMVGYATAGLLDACTSYGTYLLWPFSDERISWSIISIIDPLFTLVLAALVVAALAQRQKRWGVLGMFFAVLYLGAGYYQNDRASTYQRKLASFRGHKGATEMTVKPSIGNLALWRSIYLYDGNYYVDAIRVGFAWDKEHFAGTSVPALDVTTALEELGTETAVASDLRRFEHFSDGYLARLPGRPDFVTDLRYSAIPNSIEPLWGLDLSDINAAGHASFVTQRSITKEERDTFIAMLLGTYDMKESQVKPSETAGTP